MRDQARDIGVLSLGLAVAGIILPIVLIILFVFLHDRNVIPSPGPYVGLSVLLFLACQLLALITGWPSTNTPAGKIGFRIGLWLLLLSTILLLLAAWFYFFTTGSLPAAAVGGNGMRTHSLELRRGHPNRSALKLDRTQLFHPGSPTPEGLGAYESKRL